MQEKFKGFTFVDESSIDDHFLGRSLADRRGFGGVSEDEEEEDFDRMDEDVVEEEEDRWGRDNGRHGGQHGHQHHDDHGGVFHGGMEM